MKNPTELPDKRITLQPADKGTPADLRPQGKGWPLEKVDKPVITIDLKSNDGRKPGLLKEIQILGNVLNALFEIKPVRDEKRITPSSTPEGFKPLNDGKPIDVSKSPMIFKDPITNKPDGVLTYEVRITFLTPINPDKPFTARVKVVACIQAEPEPELESHDIDHPTENKPETKGCEDIMKDPTELPDKRITLQPADKGTPADLRPQGKGWPLEKVDKPVIMLSLKSTDGRKPGLLKGINVDGNVKEALIEVQPIRGSPLSTLDPKGFVPINDGKPVDVSKIPVIFKDPATGKPGVLTYAVKVTLLTPINPEKPFSAKLKVFACIQVDLVHEPVPVDEPETDSHDMESLIEDKPAIEGCEDIMENPTELPDKRITLQPADKGTPADLRPQGKGWPLEKVDKPVFLLSLKSTDGRKPGLLKGIKVNGNVKEALIEVQPIRVSPLSVLDPKGFVPINDGKPVDVSKTPVIFKNPVTGTPGIMTYAVKVTLLTPINPDKPFNAKVNVFACIQDDLEYITKNDLTTLVRQISAEKTQRVLPPQTAA
jgi:hypothetical protein